ncbi:MAG TPA: hypothetical protein VFU22_12030, partial [Roseiflexaceae bacterium]|nr:hypothetical protein [Roseiflexaceae bacterium]
MPAFRSLLLVALLLALGGALPIPRSAYAAGDAWGCVGRRFAGRWHTQPAEEQHRPREGQPERSNLGEAGVPGTVEPGRSRLE